MTPEVPGRRPAEGPVPAGPRRRPPHVIGLLGGVGSGKSTVARLFSEAGAHVLDADQMARDVLDQPAVAAEVVAALGPEVLDSARCLDRARVAALVFRDAAARGKLNAIIHPRVRAAIERRLAQLRASGDRSLVVLDVPLLVESGLAALCDRRLFVDAPFAVRALRVARERGWEPGELERREKTQESLEVKRRLADDTITNDGSLEPVRARVRAIIQELST